MQKFKISTNYGYVVTRIISDHPDCLVATLKIVDTRVNPPQRRYARIYVTLPNIHREVVKCMSSKEVSDRVSGFDWKTLRKMARNTTRRIGVGRLLSAAKKVSSEADSYGSAIYPPLGVTYNAIKRASRLLSDAENGSSSAIAIIQAIRSGAERGSQKHQKAAKVILSLYEASKKMDVNSWLSSRVSGWGSRYESSAPSSRSFVAPTRSLSLYRSGLR